MARITHEGVKLLVSKHAAEAKSLQREFANELELARHSAKLLDDNAKSLDEIVAQFTEIDFRHFEAFGGLNSFAVTTYKGRVLATSRVVDFYGMAKTAEAILERATGSSFSRQISYDAGRTLAETLRRFGRSVPSTQPLNLPDGSLPKVQSSANRVSYYSTRFEPEFEPGLMDVLTLIESHINSAIVVGDQSHNRFPESTFRTQFLVASHALSALEQVLRRHEELSGRSFIKRLRQLLDSPEAKIIRTARKLRNMCMHYGIPGDVTDLNGNAFMFGLVEALEPGLDYQHALNSARVVLSTMSEIFGDWTR